MNTHDQNPYPTGQNPSVPYPPGQYPEQYPPSQYTMPTRYGKQTLRHIGVGSAFKVMAVLSGLIWTIIGLFVVIFGLCGALTSINRYNYGSGYSGSSGGAVAAGLLIAYVVGIALYAIIGGILGALYAWLYNATTRMTGGLEVEIS